MPTSVVDYWTVCNTSPQTNILSRVFLNRGFEIISQLLRFLAAGTESVESDEIRFRMKNRTDGISFLLGKKLPLLLFHGSMTLEWQIRNQSGQKIGSSTNNAVTRLLD